VTIFFGLIPALRGKEEWTVGQLITDWSHDVLCFVSFVVDVVDDDDDDAVVVVVVVVVVDDADDDMMMTRLCS
jgi:hypothetical protein